MENSMNTNLTDVTDDELKAELERRRLGARPQPIQNPDFGPLIKMLEEDLESIEKTKQRDEDINHYAYEAAMTCLYGPDVFKWINKVCP
jgi:hypothetical protein